jgi:hypothetical protein
MSVVKEKPKLDLVLAHTEATGKKTEQKDRYNDALKNYSCFKELGTANFETRIPEMKFLIQSSTYFTPSDASTLSGKKRKVEESGLSSLKTVESGYLNFNLLTECYSVVTGRAVELGSYPEAPKKKN